ncbi:3'-5' exonuclease [Hymenobacter sp. UYP22]|uniref:3'-5' exonuclease n=1 Tax=Hymenobacter sp. UYP22 TaxID=3156348 RepID=UPI0033915938
MNYLLFVDTETTGLPRRWQQPYSVEQNWPHIAQLAWQLYTEAGELVKSEEAYLSVPAGSMTAASQAIHGLSPDFLAAQGQPAEQVLRRFLADVQQYRPRLVGHFLQLDFHMLGAAFWRAGLPNPLPGLPQFCTMQSTRLLPFRPANRALRLAELYALLFQEAMPRLHDASTDAAATARCFFELRRQGIISDAVLAGQAPLTEPTGSGPLTGWGRLLQTLLGTLSVLTGCN